MEVFLPASWAKRATSATGARSKPICTFRVKLIHKHKIHRMEGSRCL